MKYKNIYIVFFALMVGSGCAKLEVRVDVLNPAVVQPVAQNDYILDSMDIILAEDEIQVKQIFTDIRTAHFQAYVAKSQSLVKRATDASTQSEKDLLNAIAGDLLTGFSENIEPIYENRQAGWISTSSKIKELYEMYITTNDKLEKSSLRRQIIIHLDSRSLMLRQLNEFASKDVDKQTADLGNLETEAIKQNLANKSKQLFNSAGLLQSKYTYYVVKANDDQWADYYDRSFGKGVFGNTDIAIKALGPGNFTVKGLSFNPSDVASAASKVTTQSVLLAAQIAGVPVNISGTPSGSGAELAKSSSRISTTISEQDAVDVDLGSQRSALLRIAKSILREEQSLTGASDDERAEAITAIKAVFDSQSNRLSITTPSN